MNRRLVSAHYPYLPIRVTFPGQELSDAATEALVDTGFDGDVVLPQASLPMTAAVGSLSWRLADGSRVVASYYLGQAELDGLGPYAIVVSALGDEALIGRGLADRLRVTFDHGREVIVEP